MIVISHRGQTSEDSFKMYVAITLAAFFVAASHGALTNVDRCLNQNGACYNYASAQDCNTLSYCKNLAWTRPKEDSNLCGMCIKEIKKIQGMVEEKSTEESVQRDLLAFCKTLPIEPIQEECQKLVIENFDLIYDDIIAMLDADVICTGLHLCNTVDVEKEATRMMEKLPEIAKKALLEGRLPIAAPFAFDLPGLEQPQDDCTDCEAFMTDLKNTIMNNKKVVGDWMTMLKTECEALGEGLDALCKQNVEYFAYKTMVQLSQNTVDTKMACKAMKMCDMFKNKRVGDACTDCKTFFTDWQMMLKNNQTLVNHIVEVVSEIYCLQKPEEQRQQCARYVSMVIKVLLDQMEREDVGEICTKLEFCQAPSRPKPDLKKVAKHMAKVVLQAMPPRKLKVNGDHCTDCKSFVGDLQNVIQNNQSLVQELVDLVKQECSELGPELEPICVALIDEKYKDLLQIFAATDVDTICTTIMMCTGARRPSNGDLCSDCEAFFGDWQDIIANNKSVIDELNNLIEQQCASLGPDFEKVCDTVVKEYLPQLWDLIAETDPSEVCATLYFCDLGKVEKSPLKVVQSITRQATAMEKPVRSDFECQACQFAIEEVEKLVQQNATEQAIVMTLQKVCELYGADIRDECKQFMKDHVADIVDFLEQEVNSLDLCSKIGLCKNGNRFHMTRPKKVPKKVGIPIVCEACELVIGYIDHKVIFNRTEANIIKAMEEVCTSEVIPPKYQDQCKALIEKYGKDIVDFMLYAIEHPSLLCKALGLCFPLTKENIPKTVGIPIACEACEMVIGYIDHKVMNNRTEENIVKAMEEVCTVIPTKYQDQCKDMIEKYGKEIVDLLLYIVGNPSLVCKGLGLCSPLTKEHIPKMIGAEFSPVKSAKENLANGLECDLCKDVVREVDQLLANNRTEAEIIQALDKFCSHLGKYADQCDQMVNNYAPTIIALILQEGTPDTICALLAYCSSNTAKVENDITCDLCEDVARELESLLTANSTEKEIMMALGKVCSILPESDQAECNDLIEQYGPAILQMLVEEFAPGKLCKDIGLCTTVQKAKVENDIECDLCEDVAKELESLLTANSTEQEIIAALEKVCSILPQSDQDACNNLIQQYGPTILELLVEEFAPGKLCKDIGLCTTVQKKPKVEESDLCDMCKSIADELDGILKANSTKEEIEDAIKNVCHVLPSELEQQCDDFLIMYADQILKFLVNEMAPQKICTDLRLCQSAKIAKTATKVQSDAFCDVCKTIMGELDDMLKENATEEEIKKALESVCGVLPSDLKDTCDSLVEQYGDQIIALLVEEMEPEKICAELKLCTSVKVNKVTADVTCDVCKFVAHELEGLLTENSTEADIKKAMEEVCQLLPSSMQTECDTLIMQYGQAIVEILVETMNPSVICTAIDLCPKAAISKPKVESNAGCDVCEVVMTELKKMLDKQSTEAEIEKAVEKVCTLLPQEYKSVCVQYIEDYGPGVIAILVNDFVPDKVCAILQLCQNEGLDQVNQVHVKNDEECTVCKTVIKVLDDVLKDNATEKDLIDTLVTICDSLGRLKAQCVELVDEYAAQIFQYIDELGDPNYVCEKLRLCPSGVRKPHILGADPCTYGPSYWCSSMENAQSCNAVSHCENHVWD